MPDTSGRPSYLTDKETEKLSDARQANPWWFDAVLDCAEIMSQRVKKYSGYDDPFTNFKILARRQDMPISKVFSFYCDIKQARAEVSSGDFEDEKYIDNLIDLANYSLLWLGYEMRRRDET